MKKLYYFFTVFIILFFTSCVVIDTTPGPNGRDGNAYFGVDYEYEAPYSYWDNNESIPFNPALGEYYRTNPGIYEFEYFINEYEYWYGTYEIWINPGGIGGPNGEPGYDGLDSYLMLIADPHGFHEHIFHGKTSVTPLVIENKEEKFNYRITIQKGNKLTENRINLNM